MIQKDIQDKPVKFLFIGRTASGKSSIAKAVCKKLGLKQVKSFTTRPPREGELDNPDSDHIFVNDDEFEELREKDGFIAYTEINGFKYATSECELYNSSIYVIDPNGVVNLKENCGDKYKFIEIYFRVPYITAKQRFMERGGTGIEFKNRYDKESVQFKEYEQAQEFDYHLLNDKPFEESVNIICEIIKTHIECK